MCSYCHKPILLPKLVNMYSGVKRGCPPLHRGKGLCPLPIFFVWFLSSKSEFWCILGLITPTFDRPGVASRFFGQQLSGGGGDRPLATPVDPRLVARRSSIDDQQAPASAGRTTRLESYSSHQDDPTPSRCFVGCTGCRSSSESFTKQQCSHSRSGTPQHSLPAQVSPTDTSQCALRGTNDRLAPACCRDLPPGLTSPRAASVIRHLLSGTHFLGQFSFSIVCH